MRIPKKLKIGGHVFTVHLVSEKAGYGINTENEQGACNFGSCEIYLDKNQAQTQLEATFLHEILHAINGELDHELLTSLAEQLYQVLHDNRLLK